MAGQESCTISIDRRLRLFLHLGQKFIDIESTPVLDIVASATQNSIGGWSRIAAEKLIERYAESKT